MIPKWTLLSVLLVAPVSFAQKKTSILISLDSAYWQQEERFGYDRPASATTHCSTSGNSTDCSTTYDPGGHSGTLVTVGYVRAIVPAATGVGIKVVLSCAIMFRSCISSFDRLGTAYADLDKKGLVVGAPIWLYIMNKNGQTKRVKYHIVQLGWGSVTGKPSN
jgi:hypothetical protein